MRLIDADALIGKEERYELGNYIGDEDEPTYEMAVPSWAIIEAPTIDAVSVVRCKECKWEQRCQKAVQHTTHDPTSVTIGYKAVDYCSYGEREDE